jgi:hypothetical protein
MGCLISDLANDRQMQAVTKQRVREDTADWKDLKSAVAICRL